MFVVMTCCFDRVPTGSRTLVAERSPGGRPARTYPVPLRMQDLDGVQSPADFMTRIRRQPVIVVEPEPERRMLRAFPVDRPEVFPVHRPVGAVYFSPGQRPG